VRSYRDKRTERYADEIYSVMGKKELYFRNGNQIAPFNTLMQLAAMRFAKQGEIFESDVKLLHIPDLLGYLLTGEARCEATMASVSQMFLANEKRFDDVILEAYNIPSKVFAPLIEPGEYLGEIKDIIGKGIKVCAVCSHDTASAFVSGKPNCILVSAGTWSLVGFENEKQIINEYAYEHNIANEGGISGSFRIIKNVMGSWLSQQAAKEYEKKGYDTSYENINREVFLAKPWQYVIDVDEEIFFSPDSMVNAINSKCKEKYGSEPENMGALMRCIKESVAQKYKNACGILENIAQKKFEAINIIGGGSADRFLCQTTAEVTRRRVITGPAEATAFGNIAVQMIAKGDIKDITEAKKIIGNSVSYEVYE